MFTTLSTVNSRRLFSKIISEASEYKGCTFYYSRLLSSKKNNLKFINRFKKRAEIPVIEHDSPIVFKYKMTILANTVMRRPYKNVGIYDKEGKLPFLLPFISKNSGVIYIFTENTAAYTNIEDEILRDYGTPLLISRRASPITECDIIFAAQLPNILNNNNVFTVKDVEHFTFELPFPSPDYACKFSIAAGLFYYGGCREFGKLTFKEEVTKPPRL